MALFKPDTIQASNTKAFPIVLAKEVGGHKVVTNITELYNLKTYYPIIIGASEETTENVAKAVGQLWYVTSEKAFYQLIDYSNIDNEKGWSKTNLASSATSTGNSIGNGDTTLITSINIAGDGSMTYTSYSLSDLQSSITNTYNLANNAYTYANYIGSAYDNFYSYQSNFNEQVVYNINQVANEVAAGVVSYIDKFTADTDNAYLPYKIGDMVYNSQLDGATSSKAGVMSAQDKTRIDAIYDGDKPLASISISSGTWTIYDANGNDVTSTIAAGSVQSKNTNYICVDTGYQVSWSGTWKWTNNGSQKNPESTKGSWGTTLIPVNTNSDLYTNTTKYTVSTSNKTVASQSITAAKKGLMVQDHVRVVQASGNDTNTANVTCAFTTMITAWGFSTSNTISVNDVLDKAFKAGNRLGSPKRITFNTAPSETQYVFYVYPATNGDISAVVMNGADDVKNAWVKQGTVDVTFPVSNATIKYKVYVSTQPGAYKQSQYVDFTF